MQSSSSFVASVAQSDNYVACLTQLLILVHPIIFLDRDTGKLIGTGCNCMVSHLDDYVFVQDQDTVLLSKHKSRIIGTGHTPGRDKLFAKYIKCISLGYSPLQKGYRCYFPDT
ncbi:hypothetical protein ACH5RR_015901 [Cinchona calisaya]|uniref:Retroviral polymerase SH3-like domain-containing protein n=1 Tax=Cinchona calisaya TaxID=153742 RepID=A0ABD2ZY35_9GENT